MRIPGFGSGGAASPTRRAPESISFEQSCLEWTPDQVEVLARSHGRSLSCVCVVVWPTFPFNVSANDYEIRFEWIQCANMKYTPKFHSSVVLGVMPSANEDGTCSRSVEWGQRRSRLASAVQINSCAPRAKPPSRIPPLYTSPSVQAPSSSRKLAGKINNFMMNSLDESFCILCGVPLPNVSFCVLRGISLPNVTALVCELHAAQVHS